MPGLDKKVVGEIDWENAVKSILVDTRTDFILAPHIDIIFRDKGLELTQQLASSLTAGNYEPQLPITMSVPKQGILTRPGSILLPHDRLLYQGLVEDLLREVEAQFDRSISFSHIPAKDKNNLFESSFENWSKFQEKLVAVCGTSKFVLQCDIANYFETLPQHNLINALEGCGGRSETVRLLEKVLSIFRQKSSQGIIQGIYPSDILGNFYLTDIDAICKLRGVPSARYVDDIYIGFQTELDARIFLNQLVESLRGVGLSLNASKTKIKAANEVLYEHKEVDTLFDEARAELKKVTDFVEQGGYGFQGDWINSDDVEEAIHDGIAVELLAVRALLDFGYDTTDLAEKIDRFCLPYLRSAGDPYGVERAFQGLNERPHLTRLYFSYLNHFAKIDEETRKRIEDLIQANGFHLDYQRMYHMAGILPCEKVSEDTVSHVMNWLNDKRVGGPTRAIAAIFVSKFGTARDRRNVRAMYDEESPYIRAAILYSSQYFVGAERSTMRSAWRGHSELNALIASAL